MGELKTQSIKIIEQMSFILDTRSTEYVHDKIF